MLFDVQESVRDGWIVLSVVGEFDLASAPRVRQSILRSIGSPVTTPVRLLLDLTGVDFIDSSGLGVLIGAKRRVRQAGGEVRIVIGEAHVRSAFEITELDRVLPLFATIDEAISSNRADDLASDRTGEDGGQRG